MKEKLLAQTKFTLYVQLKESTSTYGRLISVANWKTCEIGWISPTPTQNAFIESVTTKDGVRISKLNILVPDKYLNEDVAPPSSVFSLCSRDSSRESTIPDVQNVEVKVI